MGLLDFLRPKPARRRRRRREPTERERMQRRYAEHKRKQERGQRQSERQARTERERAERQAQTERQRSRRRDVTLALRLERANARELARLKRGGWSDAEARQMLEDRDHYVDVNPSAGARLGHALRLLNIAWDWRRNPQLGSTDPASVRASEQFHGTARDAATLSDRERHTTPRDVVVIGQLESIAYKPLRGSQRASSVWLHEIGDRGWLQPKAKRKPLLVADPRTGRADIVGGSMRFEADRGLVG